MPVPQTLVAACYCQLLLRVSHMTLQGSYYLHSSVMCMLCFENGSYHIGHGPKFPGPSNPFALASWIQMCIAAVGPCLVLKETVKTPKTAVVHDCTSVPGFSVQCPCNPGCQFSPEQSDSHQELRVTLLKSLRNTSQCAVIWFLTPSLL